MSPDVMILGAGVAGTTAALALRRQGLSVLLIERNPLDDRAGSCPEWLTQPARDMLDELGVKCGDWLGEPFKCLRFHSADLGKVAAAPSRSPAGFRIDYTRLVRTLNQAASQNGVERMEGEAPVRLDFGERQVTAHFTGGEPVTAAFLLRADGARPPAGSTAEEAQTAGRWVACLRTAVDRKVADPDMHWVIGLDREQSPALWWYDGAALVLMLAAGGSRAEAAAAMKRFAARIADRGLVPGGITVRDEEVALRRAPPVPALEMDSHVDKRCLRIGDAGGFVSSTSGEGIYPAMWSARLAAETIVQAADSPHPQDRLRQFSTLWRTTMADYLRPPNTDLHFLVPLIFSNQQMADRMAAAFWTGTNI